MNATGPIIMSTFAAIWWVVGVRGSSAPLAVAYGFPVLVAAAIVGLALGCAHDDAASADEQARRGRLVGIASATEGIAIFLAVNVLINMGWRDFIAPVIAIIVGLHFLPLARALPARLYYVTCALMVSVGLAGFMIAAAQQRLVIVTIGAAVVLWLTSSAVAWFGTAAR